MNWTMGIKRCYLQEKKQKNNPQKTFPQHARKHLSLNSPLRFSNFKKFHLVKLPTSYTYSFVLAKWQNKTNMKEQKAYSLQVLTLSSSGRTRLILEAEPSSN